ncbi:MAG: caspase family protein, partial [Pseudomonadota bacterium]|nr:caspase family protein [Pseudomonadota bacterium]
IMVRDVQSGDLTTRLLGHSGIVTALAASATGHLVASGDADGILRVWNLQNETLVNKFTIGNGNAVSAIAFAPEGRRIAYAGTGGPVHLRALTPGGGGLDLKGHTRPVTGLSFSADGNRLVSGDADQTIKVWDLLKSRAVQTLNNVGGATYSIQVTDKGEFLVAGGDDNVIRVFDLKSGAKVRELEGHEGPVRCVLFDLGTQKLISASDDGTTRVWDVEKGAAFAEMISTVAGWVVLDEAGRFDGTESGFEDVHWQASDDSLALDKFSSNYYEPGLLAKRLAGEGIINADVASVPEGMLLPPKVAFVGGIPTVPDPDGRVRVTLSAQDQGGGVKALYLFHQGKRLSDKAVEKLDKKKSNEDGDVWTATFAFAPVAGENRLTGIGVGDRDIESEPATEIITYGGVATPSLHVLVIGINDYANDKLDLDYGRLDALALLKKLAAASGGIYKQVVGYQLLDRDAGKAAILSALRQMRRLSPEDVLVIYMAGHGATAGGEWYFISSDYNASTFSEKSVRRFGIPALALRDALLEVGARHVMMVMDACHSGAAIDTIGKFLDRKRLRDMGRSAGVHVLAATRADQVAFELPDLGHGLLTYALLKGFDGYADRAPKDGSVSAGEAVRFSTDTLPKLARRSYPGITQNPVGYSSGDDFKLFAEAD